MTPGRRQATPQPSTPPHPTTLVSAGGTAPPAEPRPYIPDAVPIHVAGPRCWCIPAVCSACGGALHRIRTDRTMFCSCGSRG